MTPSTLTSHFGEVLQMHLQSPQRPITIAGHLQAIEQLDLPLSNKQGFPHHIAFAYPYDTTSFLELNDPGLISLLQWLNTQGPREVLDLGCGSGKVSRWLQQHGHRVTACDLDPAILQLARERGTENTVLSDFRDLPDRFGAVLMFGGGIPLAAPHLTPGAALHEWAAQVEALLHKGGLVAFDLMNYDGFGLQDGLGHQIEVQFHLGEIQTQAFPYLALNRRVLSGLLQTRGWKLLLEQVLPVGEAPQLQGHTWRSLWQAQ